MYFQRFWIAEWAADPLATDVLSDKGQYWLWGYTGLAIGSVFAMVVQALCIATARVEASRVIHKRLVERLLHAPVAFYDTTPLGRILNRFTKDMDGVDMQMGRIMAQVGDSLHTRCTLAAHSIRAQ